MSDEIEKLQQKIWTTLDRMAERQEKVEAEVAKLKILAEQEAERRKILAEGAKRKAEQEAERRKIEAEEAKRKAEQEAERRKIEAEDAKRKAEEEEIRRKEREAYRKETERIVRKVSRMVGGMSNNHGKVAEEIFANTLSAKPVFGGVQYDTVLRRLCPSRGGKTAEFDIVMLNSTKAVLIEVKYCAHPDDLQKLVTKKITEFRQWFPAYKDFTLYVGIASLSFNDAVVEAAKKLGIGVLRQVGEHVEIDAENLTAY
jgi:hypothetical protein